MIFFSPQPNANDNAKVHEGKIFPDEGSDDIITCICLTQDFLIYGTMVIKS